MRKGPLHIYQKCVTAADLGAHLASGSQHNPECTRSYSGVDLSHSTLKLYMKGLGCNIDLPGCETVDAVNKLLNVGSDQEIPSGKQTMNREEDLFNEGHDFKQHDKNSSNSTHSAFSFSKFMHSISSEGSIRSETRKESDRALRHSQWVL